MSPDVYISKISSSKQIQELLSAPFLLKMFVEALPTLSAKNSIGLIELYDGFSEYSFDRELRKQQTNIQTMKYEVKSCEEFRTFALHLASEMVSSELVFVRSDK